MKSTPEREVCSVVILSLGAPRTMDFKVGSKTPGPVNCEVNGTHLTVEPSGKVTSLQLTPGHLVVFAGDQKLMTHGIKRLKEADRAVRPEENAPRISISARWFTQEPPLDDQYAK
eukprot:CAMPEP_0175913570 /NCGR_PEP_ID=MMETSP0108-20121206/9333_1 /TAXON_ID=195067 ORGANISM="Goniomonas pacifica, Strain CCMP1869" /NCGR_SAMPLE_ID=MMETSP0108 /ASSEMBLY_ACC=CAM_ASM_000204 /LENGTH=114 /DNA_ID=CAMNT_0017235963 /DNA_START=352 /DNA_END=696 /DNA_ORIENTATION=+